jgi:DNA replication protein DnaC
MTISADSSSIQWTTEMTDVACLQCGAEFQAETRVGISPEGASFRPERPVRIPPHPGMRYCSEECRAACQAAQEERAAQAAQARLEGLRGAAEAATWPRYRRVATPDTLREGLSRLDASTSVFLHGPVGTGKTHQAWAWWRRWYESQEEHQDWARASVQFYTAPDLFDQIRRSYRDEPFVLGRSLLVIDDLGAERATDWVLEQVQRIIDERWRNCWPMFVTSNYTLSQIGERIGERVASRLAGACEVFELAGEDRRMGAA